MSAAQAPDIEAVIARELASGGWMDSYDALDAAPYVARAVLAAGFVRPEDVAEAHQYAPCIGREEALDELAGHAFNVWCKTDDDTQDNEVIESFRREFAPWLDRIVSAAALRPVDAPEGGPASSEGASIPTTC